MSVRGGRHHGSLDVVDDVGGSLDGALLTPATFDLGRLSTEIQRLDDLATDGGSEGVSD